MVLLSHDHGDLLIVTIMIIKIQSFPEYPLIRIVLNCLQAVFKMFTFILS